MAPLLEYVALLRGINVGGHKPVAMAELRDLLARLGFVDARSLLQTGNLVFRGEGRTGGRLERMLETEAAQRLGLATDFFMFLKEPPEVKDVAALRAAITGPEIIRAAGMHAYIVYPNGIGRSRLTNTLIERTLGTRGTGRNWNTVLKLGALLR